MAFLLSFSLVPALFQGDVQRGACYKLFLFGARFRSWSYNYAVTSSPQLHASFLVRLFGPQTEEGVRMPTTLKRIARLKAGRLRFDAVLFQTSCAYSAHSMEQA